MPPFWSEYPTQLAHGLSALRLLRFHFMKEAAGPAGIRDVRHVFTWSRGQNFPAAFHVFPPTVAGFFCGATAALSQRKKRAPLHTCRLVLSRYVSQAIVRACDSPDATA
jgi:hypothetical protein